MNQREAERSLSNGDREGDGGRVKGRDSDGERKGGIKEPSFETVHDGHVWG